MSTLINRLQRAILGSAGPEKVRALLAELAIPAGGSGGSIREVRRGVLRPISDEAILRDALAAMGITGGGGNAAQGVSNIRNAVLHNVVEPEIQLLAGLDGLLEPGDLAGGAEAPAWVPANAKIHIDLVGGSPQGRAWNDGSVVAVDTLLGSEPDIAVNYSPTEYDAADLTADGHVYSQYPPALVGDAKSMALDAATIVIRMKQVGGGAIPTNNPSLVLVSADGSDAIEYIMQTTTARGRVTSWNGPIAINTTATMNLGNGSLNAMACTVTSARFDIAASGSPAVAGILGSLDRPSGNPMAGVVVHFGDSHFFAIQSITIYDPLPDTMGLSELSEP